MAPILTLVAILPTIVFLGISALLAMAIDPIIALLVSAVFAMPIFGCFRRALDKIYDHLTHKAARALTSQEYEQVDWAIGEAIARYYAIRGTEPPFGEWKLSKSLLSPRISVSKIFGGNNAVDRELARILRRTFREEAKPHFSRLERRLLLENGICIAPSPVQVSAHDIIAELSNSKRRRILPTTLFLAPWPTARM